MQDVKTVSIITKRKLVLHAIVPSLNSKLQTLTPLDILFKSDAALVADTKPVSPAVYTQRVGNRFLPASQISCCVWYGMPSHSVNIWSETGDSANSRRCLSLLSLESDQLLVRVREPSNTKVCRTSYLDILLRKTVFK